MPTVSNSETIGRERPTLLREDAVRLIQRQFGWTTHDSAYFPKGKICTHYGLCELRELLDHIYGGIPNHHEELCRIPYKENADHA